jgi:hypothetical protein
VSRESRDSDVKFAGDNLIEVGIAVNTRPVPRVTANRLSLVMIVLPIARPPLGLPEDPGTLINTFDEISDD